MERKGRKMLALGAVIMLCAVAIIGAGYAAFSGTARTYNEGNSVAPGYISMTPGSNGTADWSAIASGDISAKFDTYVYTTTGTDAKVAYQMATGQTPVTMGAYSAYFIAEKAFTVENNTDGNISAIDLVVKQDKKVGNSEFVYIVALSDTKYVVLDNDDAASITEKTISNFAFAVNEGNSADLTVKLYIGVVANNGHIPTNGIGKALTTAEYTAASEEVKAKYPSTADAILSDDGPIGFTDLGLALKLVDQTS